MTDETQWAIIVFLASSAVAMFAIAVDILSRCPELQNRIEILEKALADYHGQNQCGCWFPSCKKCAQDDYVTAVLKEK